MIGANRQPGFTLIELLITAAIFSTAALLATTVFSNIQTTQRKIQHQQRINADGRYVVETIARSIRTGNINYGQFTTTNGVVTNPTNIISIIDQDGRVTCYRLNNTKVEIATNAVNDCLGTTTWTAFTPDDLQVNALSFFINPSSDPFRPVPRANTDCKFSPPSSITPVIIDPNDGSISTGPTTVVRGFDSALGACACQTSSVSGDCFSNICTPTAPAKYNCTGGSTPGITCTGSSDTTTCGPTGTCTQMVPARLICTNPNVQPHVTIFIATTSKNAAAGEEASSTLQTTVASRMYQ